MDIIIGAGVTGISYAGFTSNDYLILEREKEIGGYCRTIKRGGYIWDFSGHFFHFRSQDIKNRVCEGIAKDELCVCKKRTQIFYKGLYVDYPFQKNIHQLEKQDFIDCLYDLFKSDDTGSYSSFKDMVIKKYGKSIADKFLIPYNEKLYACDIDNLDVNAMGRFFPSANRMEIISNFKKSDNHSYNDNFEYPKGGAIEYVKSLMNYVDKEKVSLQEEVVKIDIHKKILVTNKRKLHFDNLISTMPFPFLLTKCGIDFDASCFSSNKVLVFNIGFDSKGGDVLNSWVYFPERDFVFYRVGYYDNILNTNKMSLYVEIGISGNQKIEAIESYFGQVVADLKKAGIVNSRQRVVDYEAILMDPAYVHINHLSINAVKAYKDLLGLYDIYSIGRYGSWTYCSIEDNIIEAHTLKIKVHATWEKFTI